MGRVGPPPSEGSRLKSGRGSGREATSGWPLYPRPKSVVLRGSVGRVVRVCGESPAVSAGRDQTHCTYRGSSTPRLCFLRRHTVVGWRNGTTLVTWAVPIAGDDRAMADAPRLEGGMLLKCSKCGEWHTVRPADGNVGEAEHAKEMLYWLCRGRRFYAGQRGSVGRWPVRRSRAS